MAYNDFSLSDVIYRFELNIFGEPFCANLPVAIPSEFFRINRDFHAIAQPIPKYT
jgi:hypothetical protein